MNMRTNTTSLRLLGDRLTQTVGRIAAAVRPRPSRAERFRSDQNHGLVPLAAKTIVTLPVPEEGIEVELLTGSVWVTQYGDQSDYMLDRPGDRFQSTGREDVVLQAFKFSRVVVRRGA